MVKIGTVKLNGIVIERVWFCDNIDKLDLNGDIAFVYGYKCQMSIDDKMQHTTTIDLDENEETIFNNINKNFRYQIKRSIKENIEFKVLDSKNLKQNSYELIAFKKKYDMMYQEKNLDTMLNMNTVNGYVESEMFILTRASLGDDIFCYHAYVVNGEQTRMLYSCSNFRSKDNAERSLIGRANKYLHWMDICYFKNSNYRTYDFGGITSFESPNGIDQFKLSFGGNELSYYNLTIPYTLKGKIALLLRKAKNRIHKVK